MIGTTLAHYRILAKLGQGGMGEVYLAEDTKLKREVALKVLPEAMAANPDRRARFEREAQAIAALNHPNIVTVYSVEQVDDVTFITMERVEGQPLSALIPEDGLPLAKLFEIAIPLADAVAAAHERGITHRDLKPDNVMVGDDGRVKVLDFGLAKLAGVLATGDDTDDAALLPTATITAQGRIVGTVAYMAPEQAEGKPVDARTDVFSLGILLYEMATGRRPFTGDTPISTISSIMKDTPVSLSELKRSLPRELDRIVRRCLTKDPERRFQSAKELRNELEEFKREVDSGEIAAPVGARGQRPRWLVPAIVGAVVVAAATFAALRWLPSRDAGAPVSPQVASETAARTMIVVLPFDNVGEADDDYFAAGVTEEITTRLGGVDGLGVISNKSAAHYADSTKTTREIAGELGVDYVLEGSVRWARGTAEEPSRVRITPTLVRADDDVQVWSDTYDETIEDVFAVQARIATSVIEQLGIAIGGAGQAIVQAPTTDNLEAWQAYLRGKAFQDSSDIGNARLAVRMLERAVELDPDFVDAWSELAEAHALLMHRGADISPERDAAARRAVDRAMRLAPDSPRARLAKGFYHYWGHKDYDRAMAEFDRVLEARPNDAEVLSARGFVRRRRADWRGSLADLERANELAPLEVRKPFEVGLTRLALGDHDGARTALRRAAQLEPDYAETYSWLAMVDWHEDGDLAASRATLESIPPALAGQWVAWAWYHQHLYERDPQGALASLDLGNVDEFNYSPYSYPRALLAARARCVAGDDDAMRRELADAVAVLERDVARDPDDYSRLGPLGLAYAMLGRRDEALAAGRRAVELYGMDRDTFFGANAERVLAAIETEVGEHDAALDRLNRLLAVPNPYVSRAFVRVDPAWEALRDHPRYAGIVGN